uniref:RNase H type-1 domain-containing protein n=1 Tax=Arundo donax TaxID=35708 RepID=A0A0A9D545_ARUDO
MEEGSDYYVVRKGDMVAVYGALSDCQAQICSSVSGSAASAYKGYSWSKEKEEYLTSHGLSNASYVINAAELSEDILGPLVPCTFQDIARSSSYQPTPNHTGFHNDTRYQTGSQSVDLNHEARSSSSRHLTPKNNHSGAVDAEPVSKQYMVCILHFDGASKGNPGKAGAGAVLMTEDGRVISRLREGLGVVTNNVAEYRGLILGLKYAIRHGFKRIKVHGDSQLICYQVKGIWQTKNQNMMELCQEVRRLKENFLSFEINHVRRVYAYPPLQCIVITLTV